MHVCASGFVIVRGDMRLHKSLPTAGFFFFFTQQSQQKPVKARARSLFIARLFPWFFKKKGEVLTWHQAGSFFNTQRAHLSVSKKHPACFVSLFYAPAVLREQA